ncbi:MAG TPA: oligosaccharide flippase family protein [Solirubrobacteraceae bacterium]|nr:oligosaccharide flippase family protein [Solirubrobacteraceae bacterium]
MRDRDERPQKGSHGAGERRRLARNALGSYGARAVVGFSALALTPFLYRKLGAAGFGTWSVIYTIATVFSLFEVGYAQGIAKFVAEYDARGEDGEVRATIRAGLVAFAVIGLVAAVGCVLLGVFGDGLAAAGSAAAFRTGLIVLGLAVLIRFPLVAYGGGLQGYQRYDLFYLSDIVLGASFTIAAIPVVALGGGVLGLSICWAAALVGSALLYRVNIARVRRSLGLGSLRLRSVQTSRGWSLASFSGFTVLSESMTFVAQRMDTVIIAAVRDAATAGPYAAAIKLQSGLQAMTTPFVNLMLPMASELQARGENDTIGRRLTLATRVSLQMTLPVAAGLALFAEDVVKLWLGHDVPQTTFSIVVVLMAVQTVTLTAFPSQTVLVGVGRVRIVGLLAVVEGISNLGASIALVSAYGAIGAALGSLFTSAVLAPVKFPLVCEAIGLRLRRFLGASIVPSILSSLPGLAAMVLVRATMGSGFAQAFVGLTAGLGISLLIGLGQIGPARVSGLARELLSARNQPSVDAETQALVEAG